MSSRPVPQQRVIAIGVYLSPSLSSAKAVSHCESRWLSVAHCCSSKKGIAHEIQPRKLEEAVRVATPCHHQESRARRKTGQSRSLDHRLYSRCRVLALSLHPPFLLTNATRLARCFTRRQAEPASMTRLRRAKRFHD